MLLIDCGRATKRTMGMANQLFTEVGTAPFNKWCGYCNR